MELSFKICELKDLGTLIEISKDTFITAFEKDNNPSDFQSYIDDAFSVKKIKAELENPNSTFHFVYLKNKLIGYFKLNENDAQSEQFEAQTLELERIYVIDSFQGKGIGKQMLFQVIDIAKFKELNFLWLGVWQENKSAVRFYERYNFKIFHEHAYYIGKEKQMDWLMKLEII